MHNPPPPKHQSQDTPRDPLSLNNGQSLKVQLREVVGYNGRQNASSSSPQNCQQNLLDRAFSQAQSAKVSLPGGTSCQKRQRCTRILDAGSFSLAGKGREVVREHEVITFFPYKSLLFPPTSHLLDFLPSSIFLLSESLSFKLRPVSHSLLHTLSRVTPTPSVSLHFWRNPKRKTT